MTNIAARIDPDHAVSNLLEFLTVEGVSGNECRIADIVGRKIEQAGIDAIHIVRDNVHHLAGTPLTTGNLIVRLPDTSKGPTTLFVSHLDTVPLCRGAVPESRDNRITSTADTALGADNRTAVACLVTVIETIAAQGIPHGPLTFLFTVAEEIGLVGSRHVDVAMLGNPSCGFNIDSGIPEHLIIAAVGADRWTAEIEGVAAHAGVHPEDGVSAGVIAALAIADVAQQGYHGRIRTGNICGTSNIGSIAGGDATNQVMDKLTVNGESRSHDTACITAISERYKIAFDKAARSVRNRHGQCGKVSFRVRRDYDPFELCPAAPVVVRAERAARAIGLAPQRITVDGGLDASALNALGIPTVTFGAGQHNAHTRSEYADVAEFITGCNLALQLASEPADPSPA